MDDIIEDSSAAAAAGSRPSARMGLDPRAYQRLAATAREQIGGGALSSGDPLPSITELAREHGYARATCAKAYRLLEAEGIVTRYPGLGYYVA